MLAFLGVLWFVTGFVIPLWRTRQTVDRCWQKTVPYLGPDGRYSGFDRDPTSEAIESMGGADAAMQHLAFYLRMPEGLAPHRPFAVQMLEGCGERAVPVLCGLLKDHDRKVRLKAVLSLWRLQDDRAVGPLIEALNDDYAPVRKIAVVSLARMGAVAAIYPLVARLSDESFDVRAAAIPALVKIGGTRAIEPLTAALNDKSAGIRSTIVKALGKFGIEARSAAPAIQK
jgi:HEAT repeat protein